ncbi:hypothetical protein [Wigglesworthia glossinidia]|uniref:hypothetical protein n=1 Tax=Wigglesworthia glossinidia TaxID=51229 RepID=UPI0005A4FE68|nr:hypothetical protein [Wigglesworthia glossinidia]
MLTNSLFIIYRNIVRKKNYHLDKSQYDVILHLDQIYKTFMPKNNNLKNSSIMFFKRVLFKLFNKKKTTQFIYLGWCRKRENLVDEFILPISTN